MASECRPGWSETLWIDAYSCPVAFVRAYGFADGVSEITHNASAGK